VADPFVIGTGQYLTREKKRNPGTKGGVGGCGDSREVFPGRRRVTKDARNCGGRKASTGVLWRWVGRKAGTGEPPGHNSNAVTPYGGGVRGGGGPARGSKTLGGQGGAGGPYGFFTKKEPLLCQTKHALEKVTGLGDAGKGQCQIPRGAVIRRGSNPHSRAPNKKGYH